MNIQNHKNLFFILLIISLVFLTVGGLELLRFLKIEPLSPILLTESLSFPRKLRDATGKTLIIPSPPQRIVSQTLATDEILLAICPIDRIVAISSVATDVRYSNVVEKAHQITGQTTGNAEQILSFNPDLIFVASYSRAEMVELLQTTGALVLQVGHFKKILDIKNTIKTLGYAIGEDRRAATLIKQMETELQIIQTKIPKNIPAPRVMLYSQWGYTAGYNTTFNDMLKQVNAINIVAEQGIDGHVKISAEQIIEWQPEIIVTGASQGQFDKVYRLLLENQAIAVNQAKLNQRIIVIDNRYLNSVSQYIIYGIKVLAEKLYTSE